MDIRLKMEWVIFNELIARGANVDVGMLEVESRKGGVRQKKQYEIDFILNSAVGC